MMKNCPAAIIKAQAVNPTDCLNHISAINGTACVFIGTLHHRLYFVKNHSVD